LPLVRIARVAALTITALVLAAAPAGATTVLANDKYKWFYWLSFILAASFFLTLVALAIGYARKVLLPKYRGRRVE
jgi:hypothetical protein